MFKENFSSHINNKNEKAYKPEQAERKLDTLMLKLSANTNAELREQLILPDGSIDMEAFAIERGGHQSAKTLNHDRQHVKLKNQEFDPENKGKHSRGIIMEKAVTALLYKTLREQFLVMRANEYDDYEHGMDNVLVDKTSGQVICAIDEVHDRGDGQDTERKHEKVMNKAMTGGAKLSYGVTFEGDGQDKKLKKTSLKNIPVFALSLDTEDLSKFLEGISIQLNDFSQAEKNTFNQLMQQISEQRLNMLGQENLPDGIKINLQKLQPMLDKMQAQADKKF